MARGLLTSNESETVNYGAPNLSKRIRKLTGRRGNVQWPLLFGDSLNTAYRSSLIPCLSSVRLFGCFLTANWRYCMFLPKIPILFHIDAIQCRPLKPDILAKITVNEWYRIMSNYNHALAFYPKLELIGSRSQLPNRENSYGR